ncbi:MAG TPA: DegT/DnrJ/EryC1/StrS family aminotransferase [Thermoanaerobaculia bacterium]|nr:DegT/DnrJ/EryC1/StrS family aminotransferase [Thermoanaerobaculia bacterium]
MNIPAFDLKRATARLAEPVAARWAEQVAAGAFIGGAEVERFERAFAEYLEVGLGGAGCVGVANGTDALVVALRALGLEPGDEVIVPAFTFVATGAAVALAGGVPVFAEVEPDTLSLDVADAAARVTPRTVGVIGVHLYGRPYDTAALAELCRRRGLWQIEDAAQAQGARTGGRRVGTLGDLASWSFYPTKNLGAFGDAGAVTGNDPELLARVRRIANHGRTEHYLHAEVGTNSRLDALQATVLALRLTGLDEANRRRREIAGRYREALAEASAAGELELLRDPEGTEPVYHQFTLLTDRRDALKAHLAAAGIGSGIYYPIPLHRQPALERFVPAGLELPVAEAAARRALSLPMFPELEDGEVERVAAAAAGFFA